MRYKNLKSQTGFEIAIIGLGCRFPGADNPDEFWRNLLAEKESIIFFKKEEIAENVPAEFLKDDKNYIPACGYLDKPDFFDASFFEFSKKEALLLDPQIRLFLECSWAALEESGYADKMKNYRTGVFGTASDNFLWQVVTSSSAANLLSENYLASILNNKDFISTITSYRLNLTGASINLNTACSSSLVAVHQACQSLLSGNVDLALAGGVSIKFPFKQGYVYQDGMILSKDGHCRSFDINASGTVGGNGGGVVLLKLLDKALEDNDHIYAVIKGSAINNDGIRKIGYTAPSIDGQAEVIVNAHYMAEIEPDSIGYVEAHGSGTQIGDQIEIEALKKAFNSKKRNYCAVGSVKSNIGHLDSAAGIAGLIKATLSVKHRKLVGTLNFENPNKDINFEESPFYVNVATSEFMPTGNNPLRAGVSSFGIGGTNAHLVIEECPEENVRNIETVDNDFHLLLLSAKTEKSLKGIAVNYKKYFMKNNINFSDAAFTTRVGRKHFNRRRFIVCRNKNEAIEHLADSNFISSSREVKYSEKEKKIFLLFSSEGRNVTNNLPVHSKYADILAEYICSACEFITPKNWEDLKENIQREQDAVSVVIEVGNSAGFKAVFDELAKQNDCIEYIHIFSKSDENLSDKSLLYKTIGSLWELGLEILWEKIDAGKEHYVIPLPTYDFDKAQFTLKLDNINLKRKTSPEDNGFKLFERTWETRPLASAATSIPENTIVLFADNSRLKESLLKAMEEWCRNIIVVTKGEALYKESDNKYIIRENNFDDYIQLLYLLEKEQHNALTYIHLFSLTEEFSAKKDNLPFAQITDSNYYSLLYLARALGYLETLNKNAKNLFVISNNLLSVGGNDEVLIEKAGLLGLIRSISVEFPLSKLKYLDFDLFSGNVNFELIARQITGEIIRPDESCLLAFRGKKRYIETFKQIDIRQELPDYSSGIGGWNIFFLGDDVVNDNYLLPIQSALSGLKKGKITLVSRKPLIDIKLLEGLKEKGIEAETLQCDFYIKNELDSLLANLHQKSIDGIFCVGMVKEQEGSHFILETHDEQLEKDYMKDKWSFALNLFNGSKDLNYRFVMFCLPGDLYTGKEGYSLGAALVHAINGLCNYINRNNIKEWYTFLSYGVSALQDGTKKISPLSFAGSSTEIILSQCHPGELVEKSRKSYDELFNVFLNSKHSIKEVFYKPAWIGQRNINITPNFREKSCVLFASSCKTGQMLEDVFSTHFKNIIIVREGEAFSKFDEKTYYIDSSVLEQYYELFDNIQYEMGLPDIIIHGLNFNESSIFSPQNLDKDMDRGLYSLINIARAMGRFDTITKTIICSLTNNIIKILETDIINPGKAAGLAAVKVIPFEYPSLSCLNIDIDVEDKKELKKILNSILIDIFLTSESFSIISYRKGLRYIEKFERAHPLPEKNWNLLLKEKGIYLITGGLGGIGFSIATYLAKTYRAKCVLVGRSPFPSADEWKDYLGTNKKNVNVIKKLLELEALGAEFLVVSTDITDREQVSSLEKKIEQRWGSSLSGIIHTAGLVDYNGIIQNRPREKTAEVAAPKINGTINLDQVFNKHKLDFFVLCSSIGNIIPASKVGEVGYMAGNEFLDAYTHYKCSRGEKVVTINWSDWSEVGMSVDSHYKRFEGKDFVPEFDETMAMKPEEGIAAFYQALHMNQQRIAIAPYDLSLLILKDVEMKDAKITRENYKPEKAEQKKSGKEESNFLSKTEAKMLDIYREHFKTDNISIEDNFFDIGGDSLMAMSILSYIHAYFDVKLPVDKFFNQPTIRQVAVTIDSLSKKQFTTITKAEPKEFYSLSPAQERMFVTEQLYKEMALTTYNEPQIIKLNGKVDISRIEWAFIKIVERHESFRTSYHFNNKIPIQKIHKSVPFKVEIMDADWSSIASVIRDFIKPFDLSIPPLIRVALVNITENEWLLVIDKHHITCDGFSYQLLSQDFVDLYSGEELPEQALQYVDYSEWYNHTYRESMQVENERFWLDLFKDGVPELKLPYDNKKTPSAMFRGALLDFELSLEQSETWRSVFAGTDTTQFVITLAIYALFLAKITGQRDFVIGSPIYGRWHKDMNSIVGMFVNMLSFRIRFEEEYSFLDFLKVQKEHYLEVFENQYYPFDLLVKKVVKKRDLMENPIFKVSLEQHTFADEVNNSENKVKDFTLENYQLPSEYINARFDLSLLFGEKGDCLAFRILYASELFDESTIQEYHKCFTDIIGKILENPLIPIGELLAPDILCLPKIQRQELKQIITYADASSHQERLWFIDNFEANKLYKGSPVYHNIPYYASLDFVPDSSILQKTVNAVFNKYDALCTTIHTQSYKPIQVIAKPASFSVQVKVREFDESSKDDLLALIKEEVQIPFVLDKSPLIRVVLFSNLHNHSLLVIVAHHIICDNQSLKLLLKELITAYQSGGAVKYDEDNFQYTDYSNWQTSISADAKKQLLVFWKNTLIDRVRPLELYTDFPRKDIHIYKAGINSFNIPEDISEKINNRIYLKNIDTATMLMAGFQTLLYRYSNSENITIGIMTDNRSNGQEDLIIGPLAGLMTISIDINPGMTFEELVIAADDFKKRCKAYKDIPFEQIVTYINPKKDMSRTALFDILFRYSDITDEDDIYKCREVNMGLGKYDLNLLIEKEASSFAGTIVYNTLYYNSNTIEEIVQNFIVLLDQLFTDSKKELLDYPIITEEVKKEILGFQQCNKSIYSQELSLFDAFKKQAEKTPDKKAITFKNRSISYKELERLSTKLSDYLLESYKIEQGEIVALLMHNSEWMIIVILAVLRAGGCYLPINIENPTDRIKYYMEDCKSRLLITDQDTNKENDYELEYRVFNINRYENSTKKALPSIAPSLKQITPAYIIYTSGTTGNPKGCVITHRNVIRLILNPDLPFNFTKEDKWIMAHAYSFDFSVWEIFGSLLTGGELVIPSIEEIRDVERFLSILKKHKITVLNQTPGAFSAFMLVEKNLGEPDLQQHLRYVCFGGAKLETYLLKDWIKRYPLNKITMCNLYGITETTVHTTYHFLRDDDIIDSKASSNIGGPLPETEVYILNDKFQLVPRGVIGEIYVGGSGVSAGYLNRPELNKKAFVVNPFNPAEILYKSGDLGRWISKNNIQYMGRKDRQVKIRGYRIELGEIESRLKNYPGINQVHIIQNMENEKLCAYIVADRKLEEEYIKSDLSWYLPEYMIPSYFIQLENIPLNKNNKVDTQALPLPEEYYVSNEEFILPRNETEEKIRDIIKDLLKINKISVLDNYFDMGVDSLMLIQLHSRISEDLGIKLSLMELFKHTTISQLANFITHHDSSYKFDEAKAKQMAGGVSKLEMITRKLKDKPEEV